MTCFAQIDERQPGLYAIVDGESIPINFTLGFGGGTLSVGSGVGNARLSADVVRGSFHYKGVSSDVVVSRLLVLVVDPQKKYGIISPRRFDFFVKNMTPNDMMLVPLTINERKQRREYGQGTIVDAFRSLGKVNDSGLEWRQISDNSFEIILPDLIPGEYGIIFRVPNTLSYNVNHMFGFTVK